MSHKTNVNWVKFAIGVFLSTVLSLSVHAVMLQEMNVPFPDLSVITTPYKFIIRIFSVLGLLVFWQLADKKRYNKPISPASIAPITAEISNLKIDETLSLIVEYQK